MGKNEKKKDSVPLNIALAGNPNVGKSTVFNALTGMNQHTGNWTGKTVSTARGCCTAGDQDIILTDLPGTYSLMAHSAEEQVARDYICFSGSDGVIVVCDGSCLERNLNLVLQTLEITSHAAVCVNLLDEAAKKKICVDLDKLARVLGVPVCGTAARSGRGLDELTKIAAGIKKNELDVPPVKYCDAVEKAVGELAPALEELICGKLPSRFAALRILEHCEDLINTIDSNTCGGLTAALDDCESPIGAAYRRAEQILRENGMDAAALRDHIVMQLVKRAEEIAEECVTCGEDRFERDRRIDRVLTHRIWGLPVMLLIMTVIFFITIKGANYPSEWLQKGFGALGEIIREWLVGIGTAPWVVSMLIDGIYCVVAWVVSVMLPPMAIFFPMFTLLEDVGYLPRAAFNLDRYFARANACGKQALTMAMGLGCNAVGITGCRIIDSPRERLIAILTNVFMPCNGRFPALITLSALFFAAGGAGDRMVPSLMLTGIIVLGAVITFAMSKLLSGTVLKGEKSSFALELPPYRRPQIGKVIIRSLLDRTMFVLGRAVTSAAPAGLIIWLLTNITVGDRSIAAAVSDVLDPIGAALGMDGAILIAFLMGFPANEIVLPVLVMLYTDAGTLSETGSSLAQILTDNGWTVSTALCFMVFMLCHFPCATSVLTVRKETGSWKWAAASMLIPAAAGIVLCMLISLVSRIF